MPCRKRSAKLDQRIACQAILPNGKRCGEHRPGFYMVERLVQHVDKRSGRSVERAEQWCLDCAITDPAHDPTRLMDPDELKVYRERQGREDRVPIALAVRGPVGWGLSPLATFIDKLRRTGAIGVLARLRSEKAASDRELKGLLKLAGALGEVSSERT